MEGSPRLNPGSLFWLIAKRLRHSSQIHQDGLNVSESKKRGVIKKGKSEICKPCPGTSPGSTLPKLFSADALSLEPGCIANHPSPPNLTRHSFAILQEIATLLTVLVNCPAVAPVHAKHQECLRGLLRTLPFLGTQCRTVPKYR